MTPLISKTTRDGKALEITCDGGDFVATLNGKEIARSWTPGYFVAAKQLHVFAGKVGLTKAEGNILIEADKARTASYVPGPATRADLLAEYHALIEEQAEAYERAHDRQDARAMAIKMSFDAKIEASAQAIRDYDTTHPEETAQRAAESAAAVERNRWM